MKKKKSAFYKIQGVWIEKAIFSKKFCCDLPKCKGACCWEEIGSEGCTITPEEKQMIDERYPGVTGVTVEGEFIVTCDSKEVCNLCHWTPDGIGVCKLQSEGIISKPLSCGLYPVMQGTLGGEPTLELGDVWDNFCVGAEEKGELENVTVYDLCREHIKRLYGDYFVNCCDVFYRDPLTCKEKEQKLK